ncbi:ABC transporter substrate-binding protein [Tistrella bauzanensis]|uniref:ABC transporter substrate-binding protein n=1 Tax=Tistrella arctica TaxID=3133430 RepID=A0ABU9YQP9_9PROT
MTKTWMAPLAVVLGLMPAMPALAQTANQSQTEGGTPVDGGIMRVAIQADIRSLDGSRVDTITDLVLHHIYEQLVAYREDLTVGPALAESWTVSDDRRRYALHLREGAVYHDGTPVKAADFVPLWNDRMGWRESRGTPWVCAATFDGTRSTKVTNVSATDERTITFTIDQPDALFLAKLADLPCNVWMAAPANFDAEGKWKDGSAIGSGSLKLKSWKKEQMVALERFDGYVPSTEPRDGYGGDRTMHFDEVDFVVVPDKTAAETALYAGQIDVVTQIQTSRIKDVEAQGAKVMTAPGLSMSALLIQTNDPVMSNQKLRQAIAHAIDVRQIATLKTDGLIQPNPSGVPESSAIYGDAFKTWPAYDPAKAKALLKEAGYDGQPIVIEANKRYIGMYDNAVIIQAMLMAAGINAQIEVLDWAAQLDHWMSGKFQMMSFGFASRTDPVMLYGLLVGDKTKTPTSQFSDPKAIELLHTAASTEDVTARGKVLAGLQKLMADQVPVYPLFYYPVVDAVSPNLAGYEPWSLDKPRTWGVWRRQ